MVVTQHQRVTTIVLLTLSVPFMNSCIYKHQRVTTMVLLTLSIHFMNSLLVNTGVHTVHRER
jgi:hypothetical protein